MIRSFKRQRRAAAVRAGPRLLFQGDCARPHASNKEEHPKNPELTLRLAGIPVKGTLRRKSGCVSERPTFRSRFSTPKLPITILETQHSEENS